jgi:hypothetical protein
MRGAFSAAGVNSPAVFFAGGVWVPHPLGWDFSIRQLCSVLRTHSKLWDTQASGKNYQMGQANLT